MIVLWGDSNECCPWFELLLALFQKHVPAAHTCPEHQQLGGRGLRTHTPEFFFAHHQAVIRAFLNGEKFCLVNDETPELSRQPSMNVLAAFNNDKMCQSNTICWNPLLFFSAMQGSFWFGFKMCCKSTAKRRKKNVSVNTDYMMHRQCFVKDLKEMYSHLLHIIAHLN